MRNSSLASLATANVNLFVFGRQSRSVELITLILSVLTMAVGLVGNLLLSLTIATSTALRTPMNTFVLSIGLVDLLTSVFLLPLRVFVERQLLSNQEIDPTIYGVELFVRTFTDITRLFLMMSLSVERYQSIANPLSVSKVQAKRRALIMSCMTWTVSIILSGISISYFCDTVLHQPCLDSTSGATTNWGNLEIYVEMPLTVLSILAIAVCYSLIVIILRQQRKKMAGHLKTKMNQIMPVDTSKMSQIQLNNGSKVEISEAKEKTSNINLNSTQDVPRQSHVTATVKGECNVSVSDCVVKNEKYSDNVKTDKADDKDNHNTKLHISITDLNKVKADGIENNNTEVPQQLNNNSVSSDINSNMRKQNASHEDINNISENVENINYGLHCCSTENKRKMSTSSRSPLIINSDDIVTESNDCLCEDAKGSPESHVVNDTNTATTHTITHSTHSTVEGSQAHPSLQGPKQSVKGGTYSLADFVVTESATELTHNVSSIPQRDPSGQTHIQRLMTVQLNLTNDNGHTFEVTSGQPSLSLQSSDRYHEIQHSIGQGKQRQSFLSRATASNPKASPRLRNIHSQRLQSVIAFLHAGEPSRAKNKLSSKNTLYCSGIPTDFKVTSVSEDTDHNQSQVPNLSKAENPRTDQPIHLTNDNPVTPSAIYLNSHSPSSLSDYTHYSSTNTTLQTSVDSDLGNAQEHLLQISNKDTGSVTMRCERSTDNRCSDDMSTCNNIPSIPEIQPSDRQQQPSQLATNRINSPSHQQVNEHTETKDYISMPEISIVDTLKQDIPISVDINHQTHSCEQKTIPTDKSNDKGQDKSPHVTEGSKHVEIVDMDGTVHLQIVNSQNTAPIEGAVCLMNPRNKEQGKRRVELKAAMKVGLIVCCFACLWMPLPLSVCILRGTSCWTDSMKVDMLAVFSSLATSTAAIDPILYGLLNPQIRSALQATLYKIRRKVIYYCTK